MADLKTWGTFLQIGSTLLGGQAEKMASKVEAAAIERAAGLEVASSQREAIERRRNARYVRSRAKAVAAASGAGASDPTVVNIMGDLEAEGEYQALTALYEGEERAGGLKEMAAARRAGGRAAQTGSFLRAGATILDYGQSLREKYG